MLLRFSVENHLSICKRQELLFVASSLKDRRDALIPCESVKSGKVVPTVVIYGANASGKTNFVDAVSTMTNLVLWSQTKGDPSNGVPRRKFLLDRGWSEMPSCFEIDFVIDGVRYHYGFEATDEEFTSEWLYAIPKAHRRMMFERKKEHFTFGRWLRGQNNSIAGLTRPNSLFLSAAAQNGHEQLFRVYKYFRDMKFSSQISVRGIEASKRLEGDVLDRRVIDFLQSIDTGVIDFRKKETIIPEELKEIDKAIRREVQAAVEKFTGMSVELKKENEEKIVDVELAHRGKGGENIYFDLDRESAGTRRLVIILGHVFNALDNGLPIFIDELDASLHTYACEAILRLFCSPEVNSKGAQLIATTHDTNVMNSNVLRRDELWFVEKNSKGSTELFPLTDIRTRKGDNVQLGYLQGRYGAVPTGDPLAALVEPN